MSKRLVSVAAALFFLLGGWLGAQVPIAPTAPKPAAPTDAGAASASDATDVAPQPKSDIVVTTQEVLVPTTVLDKGSNYVVGLPASAFTLFDNNKPQTIQVSEVGAPLSIVVALQANAKVEAVLPKVKKLGDLFKNMLAGEQGEVALVAFDHRVRMLQNFTSDPDQLDAALAKVRPGSSSSRMIDAVVESTRMLRNRPKDRRRVLLLISESRDIASESKVREALTGTDFADVAVYALNISRLYTEFTASSPLPRPDQIPPTARPVPGGGAVTPTTVGQLTGQGGYGANFAPLLKEIFESAKGLFVENPVEIFTRYSGGKEYPFVSQRDLERAVSEVGRELHNQYVITYTPNNKGEAGFHSLRVDISRANLEVRHRDGYWWAGGTP